MEKARRSVQENKAEAAMLVKRLDRQIRIDRQQKVPIDVAIGRGFLILRVKKLIPTRQIL